MMNTISQSVGCEVACFPIKCCVFKDKCKDKCAELSTQEAKREWVNEWGQRRVYLQQDFQLFYKYLVSAFFKQTAK